MLAVTSIGYNEIYEVSFVPTFCIQNFFEYWIISHFLRDIVHKKFILLKDSNPHCTLFKTKAISVYLWV